MPNAQKFTELDQVKAKLAISEARVAELLDALRDTQASLEDMTSEDFANGADRILRERIAALIAKA